MSADVMFAAERVRDLWGDLPRLAQAHHEERGVPEPLDLDFMQYEVLDALQRIRCYTARIGGALVGYASYIVGGTMHHRTLKRATHEALYVMPEYRAGGTGARLLAYAERMLASEGIASVTAQGNSETHARLYARLGYRADDTIYVKDL